MNKQCVKKQIWINPDNLPFNEYYERLKSTGKREIAEGPTELDAFVADLGEELGVNPGSVRRWVYGYYKPSKLVKEAIARFMQSDVEILFPETAAVC